MKLRNKKTGEIVDYISFEKGGGQISMYVFDTNKHYYYNSLAKLNKEWGDYEEPKTCWYLDCNGEPIEKSEIANYYNPRMKKIGNYFSSREEAEKAVRKLKAWKRLKDKGFKISLKKESNIGYLEANWQVLQGDYSDVDICFGGES